MQTTTSIKTMTLIGALSLFGGAVFADSHGKMEDAVTKADEAVEAEMKAAEAVEEAKVEKAKAMEKQGGKFEAEEVGGVQGSSTN
ncbi:MAG: hypothetical protein WBM40_21870 [Thiohalocapsa sp.]